MTFYLRTKLMLGLAAMLLVIIAMGSVNLYISIKSQNRLQSILKHETESVKVVTDLLERVSFAYSNSLLHLFNPSMDEMDRYEAEIADRLKRIGADVEALRRSVKDQAILRNLEAFEASWNMYMKLWNEQARPLSRGNRDKEAFAVVRKTGPAGAAVTEAMDRLNELWVRIAEQMVYQVRSAEEDHGKTHLVLLAIILAAVTVCFVLGTKVSARIAGGVNKVSMPATKVADGDFDQRVEVRTGDEIESMADAFNTMTARLRTMKADEQKASEAMRREIVLRERAEAELRKINEGLETLVSERTADLTASNERLKESEEKFRVLAEESPFGISTIGEDGHYRYVNPTFVKMFGYALEDIADGREWFRKAYPDSGHRDRVIFAWISDQRTSRPGEPRPRVFSVTCKDGSQKKIQFIPVMLKGGDQFVIYVDITRERELEAMLRQSQKMEAFGTLASGIAHDFNNILSAIIGYAELAKMKLPKESDVMPDLDEVRKAGNRARNLIRQILTVGRQSEEEREPMQPVYIVKEALKLLRASVPSSIQFDTTLDKDAGTILADSTRIHQVLMNLCTNAQHAMQEKGGTLTVLLENVEVHPDDGRAIKIDPGPYVRLTVGDTGYGMTSEVLERIFDPYFTTKGRGEGTGLGLAVVHGIVESYGGKITVYSEPEKGTTFHVYFPRIDGASKKANRPEDPAPLPTGTERILFVDDEAPLANLGKRVLENLGYRVTALSSSVEALRLFSEEPGRFGLVITDLTMPEMTGDSLAQEMIGIRPGMPVIIASGFIEKSVRQKVKATGASAFIEKPLTVEKLASTIRDVLDKRVRDG